MSSLIGLVNVLRTIAMAVFVASFLCICVAVHGQTESVPYDRDFGPGYFELALDKDYPGSYENIRAVNFGDHDLTIFDQNKHVLSRAKLKNGWYEHNGRTVYETLKLDSVYYLPSRNPDYQYALVLYTWFAAAGSSNTNGIAEMYGLTSHQLKLLQQFSWDEHFETDKDYFSYSAESQTLTVRSAHYLPGDAHCCISAVDTISLRWDGNRLTKRSLQVELSKYGREGGKKLKY